MCDMPRWSGGSHAAIGDRVEANMQRWQDGLQDMERLERQRLQALQQQLKRLENEMLQVNAPPISAPTRRPSSLSLPLPTPCCRSMCRQSQPPLPAILRRGSWLPASMWVT